MWDAGRWQDVVIAAKLRLANENGHELIEYGLILALISIVSIGVMEALGVDLSGLLDQGSKRMSSVTNP
jgi:Flp pilus assembly pilin Flp